MCCQIATLLDLDVVYVKPYEGLYCFQELADLDLARVLYSNVQFSNFTFKALCTKFFADSSTSILLM